MIDYLIVGSGLAGISFTRIIQQHKKSFLLYDDKSEQSSTVAAGICNPVVLKRFKAVWNAKTQLEKASAFYLNMEKDYGFKIYHKTPIYRKFASIEEQNLWFEATDKPVLQDFLSTNIITNTNPNINAPFSFGKVQHTARVDVARLQEMFRQQFQKDQRFIQERFDYKAVQTSAMAISYKGIHARHLVFCEGFGLRNNPFFNYLPLQGTKGELINIRAPKLKLKTIIKSSIFLIPLGNHIYKVGATYNRDDKTQATSAAARKELVTKLKKLINCPFDIVQQEAGIRPTVSDRRPLAGTHPKIKRLHILNGLGSRGVMMAPFVADQLYHHIEYANSIDAAIDIQRFKINV